MKLEQVIISFLLLFTYSLGFAHNLLPHCQDLNSLDISLHQEEGQHHHHEHHEHGNHINNDSTHDHFSHEGHFDEGIYDLVLCIINEVEHPLEDCNIQNYLPSKSLDITINDFASVKSIAVILSFAQKLELNDTSSNYAWFKDNVYLLPPIEHSPHRGPPFFIS